jgi:hypothetical protein
MDDFPYSSNVQLPTFNGVSPAPTMPQPAPVDLASIVAAMQQAPTPAAAAPPSAQLPPAGNPAPAGNMGRLQNILRTVVPLLAAAYAAKQGSLGSFAEGYQGAEKQRADLLDQQEQRKIQKNALTRQAERDAREDEDRRIAREEKNKAAREAAVEKIRTLIRNGLDEAAKDSDFMAEANKNPEKYHITVPGIGNVSIRDGVKFAGGVIGADGSFHWGARAKPVKPPMVWGRDEKGVESRVEDTPGLKRYPVPHVPAKPDKPTFRVFNYTEPLTKEQQDDDQIPKTYRIVEDEQGNEISRREITSKGATPPAAAPSKPATPGAAKPKYHVGQKITLKDGSVVTIKEVLPDGKYRY